MTKREILERMKGAFYVATGPAPEFRPTHRVDADRIDQLITDLAADVRAEEAPRHPEDEGSEEIRSFEDARWRVQDIRDWVDAANIKDTVLAVMLRVLCADLTDAHAECPVSMPPLDYEPVPDPASVSVTVPDGFRVVVERVGREKT